METIHLIKENFTKHITNFNNKELINFKNSHFNNVLNFGLPQRGNKKYLNFEFIKYLSNENINLKSNNNYILDVEEIFKCDVPDLNVFTIFTINGFYYKNNNLRHLQNEGVIIKTISNEQQLQDYVSNSSNNNDFLSDLVDSFFNEIILIHIPKGIKLSKPLQIINLIYEYYSIQSYIKFILLNESEEENDIILCNHSIGDNVYIFGININVILKANSKINIYQMQNINDKTFHFVNSFVNQEYNSKLKIVSVTLRSGIFRNNTEISLNNQLAESKIYGLWLTDKEQITEYHTNIEHNSPNTSSLQLFKSILDNKATGIYSGKIVVKKNSQKVTAYQSNKNLLISKEAKIKSLPHLEIYADDVKCSHGSATGKLDDDALFYLISRGIPHKEACILLMEAFSSEIVNKVDIESLKNSLQHLVNKRLRGELEYCHRCNICKTDQ
ncbi:MAG: Fe-S cluster assembly protein SufD [Bacteroidales bacterium]|nr:Fe-S cluster assembly protein SufD [Bacteroidales bacterium]